MPLGSPAIFLANTPPFPWVMDPVAFNRLTSKAVFPISKKPWPGFQSNVEFELKSEGIVGELRVYFEGEITGAGAGAVDPLFGYKLADKFTLSAGGKKIQGASGIFYHVLRFVKKPALQRNTEFYTATTDENGRIRVLWIIPVASDAVSLAGAVWAQSDTIEVTVSIDTPTAAELDITGAPVVTGNFWVEETIFEIPWHPEQQGHIVIPDLRRLHGIITKRKELAQVGEGDFPLRKVQATMMRLFAYIDLGGAGGIANPVDYAAMDPAVEKLEFVHGAQDTPYRYSPAWGLAARNSEDYSAPLPKGWIVMDLVKENGPRDVGVLSAMTDPRLVVDIRDAAVLDTAFSHVELVEQVQYVKGGG